MRLPLLFPLLAAPALAQTPACPRDAAGLRDATGLRADAMLNCACTGGQVGVNLTEGPASHPGSMRHAVQTRDFGAFARSFAFADPQATAPREPVRGPVAESLATQGRISLHIHFRTASAELEPAATPVLEQLRAALAAQPEMRPQLLGHTDTQGGPAINNPLSARPAAAVREWLARHGVAAARITTDGRGEREPIADNANEAGRALNRRVEAIRQD